MWKRTLVAVVLLTGGIAAAGGLSPALRARAQQEWAQWGGWTEAARRADPVGFCRYAERQLRHDLEVMETSRRELSAEIGRLAAKARQQQAMADQAQRLAEQFRQEYQQAAPRGGFPVEVHGAAYTEPQLKSQVSMLLAEATGYRQSLGRLEAVRNEAEIQVEDITVRINATETQLTALAAKRELIRARQLSLEGEQLLAQVDQVLDGNTRMIEGNPVRTVRQLLAGSGKPSAARATQIDVEAFLAARPHGGPHAALKPAADEIQPNQQTISVQQFAGKTKPPRKPGSDGRQTPIFQQY